MFGLISKTNRNPIGLVVDSDAVYLARIRKNFRTGMDVDAVAVPYSSDVPEYSDRWAMSVADAIHQGWAEQSFAHRTVVSCLPQYRTGLLRLRLPKMPVSELDRAVHWLAAKELSKPKDDLCVSYYDVGTISHAGKRYNEVIALSAATQDLVAHTKFVNEAGLTLDAVDSVPGALVRCLEMGLCEPWNHDSKLVVYITASQTTLICVHNSELRFVRDLPSSGLENLADRVRKGYPNDACTQSVVARLLGQSSGNPVRSGKTSQHSQSVLDAQVDRRLNEICAILANEIVHEIDLCMHYLSDIGVDDCWPKFGCVVGTSCDNAFAQAFDNNSDLKFYGLGDKWSPEFNSIFDKAAMGGDVSKWLLPIGLAFYGVENMVLRCAS